MAPRRRDPTSPTLLMQLRLPLDGSAAPPFTSPPPPARERERVPGPRRGASEVPRGAPIFVRNPRARRYVLRVSADGAARITIPRGGSRREAESFLAAHADWLAKQRAKVRATADRRNDAWNVGSRIFFRGERVPVGSPGDPPGVVALGAERVHVDARHPAKRSLVAHLRALASRELPARVREVAHALGLSPGRVIVRDQQSRWGSCSPSGTISLNWRLVQMPPEVADYVIVHELMHLQQPNHSPRFWRLVRRACPWVDDARAWLRRHGPDLL